MTGDEVRKLNDQEISEEIERLRRRRYELRAAAVVEKLENPHEMGLVRRDVARLMTERRARQIAKAAGNAATA